MIKEKRPAKPADLELQRRIQELIAFKGGGHNEAQVADMIENALKLLADAGAFAIVLELVTPPVAKEITAHMPIPTIGIGSGDDCDGQILVTLDLVGLFPWFTPRFVKPRLRVGAEIKAAVAAWKNSIAPA